MPLFLETISIDYPTLDIPLLHYHEQRMKRTQLHFWNIFANQSLKRIILEALTQENLAPDWQGVLKCRVIYDLTIQQITFAPYTPTLLHTLKIVTADDLDYTYKYADRTALNLLKAQYPTDSDILILKNGLLTDISYANVAFLIDNQWLTPKTPLLKGTQRQQFLTQALCVEANIGMNDLKNASQLMLFNAMMTQTYHIVFHEETLTLALFL